MIGDFDSIVNACDKNDVKNARFHLTHSHVDPSKIKGLLLNAFYRHHVALVDLLLSDKRVNPKGENGIKFKNGKWWYEIIKFDCVFCLVKNENVDSIQLLPIREKAKEEYLKWQYRIGGDKHSLARISTEN